MRKMTEIGNCVVKGQKMLKSEKAQGREVCEETKALVEVFSGMFLKIAESAVNRRPPTLLNAPDLLSISVADGKLKLWLEKYKAHDPKKRAPLKSWLAYKFKMFCGDELRRKQNSPVLNYDNTKGTGERAEALRSVQLEESFERPAGESDTLAGIDFEVLDTDQLYVIESYYLHRKTLQDIADDMGCHKNTVFYIKASALQTLRENF